MLKRDVDVVIVGAGIAGMRAAETLRQKGISFVVLEAAGEVGGRIRSLTTPGGAIISAGGQWQHGAKEDNPLHARIKEEGLAWRIDPVNRTHYFHGVALPADSEIPGILDRAVSKLEQYARDHGITDFKKLKHLSLADIIDDPQELDFVRKTASYYGTSEMESISVLEELGNVFGSGGMQLIRGMSELVERMAEYVGWKHIHCGREVTRIDDTGLGVRVFTSNNEQFTAHKVIYTPSVAVMRDTTFNPPLDTRLKQQLSHLMHGHITKVVLDLEPHFAETHPELIDTRHDEWAPGKQMFFHVMSHGAPTVTAFFGGEAALKVEKMNEEEAKAYALELMRSNDGVEALVKHVQPTPALATDWHKNPYTKLSYTTLKVGGVRTGPWEKGNILFAGEAFDELANGNMFAAYRSGERAANYIAEEFRAQTPKNRVHKGVATRMVGSRPIQDNALQ